MGIFKNSKLNEARSSGGGVYFQEGTHEAKIVSWKSITTRPPKNEQALVVDFQILASTNESHRIGSIRNFYSGEKDQMFDIKVRNLIIAASGVSEALDSQLVESTDWLALLNTSVTNPQAAEAFIGNMVCVQGDRMLRSDGVKAARRDPALSDNPEWFLKNSYIRVTFSCHEETRQKRLEAAKGKK